MEWKKLATLRTERHKEGEVMFEKIKEEVESIRRQCEGQAKELTERQLRINEQYKKIAQDQDEIQQELQELRREERRDEMLLDEAVGAACLTTECKFQYFQHFIIPKSTYSLIPCDGTSNSPKVPNWQKFSFVCSICCLFA